MEISEEKITLEVEYEYEKFKRAYFDSLKKIPTFAAIINRPSNIVIIVAISLVFLYFYSQFSISLLLITLLSTTIILAGVSRMMASVFKKWFELSAKYYYQSEGKQLNLHRTFVFENNGIEVIFGKTVKKTT